MSGPFLRRCFKEKLARYFKQPARSRLKLPLNHREISRMRYYEETFRQAWKWHLAVNNLQVPEPVFRKVLYDAMYDALENEYGKRHKADFITEYVKYNAIWEEKYQRYHAEIADWESYRGSNQYKWVLEQVAKVKRYDHRAEMLIDNALAFLYARYQKKVTAEKFFEIEQKLLGWAERLWSKKWAWVAAILIYFDASRLYGQTLGRNKYVFADIDLAQEEAIKINLIPWYEREDIVKDERFKFMSRVYDELLCTVAGELGSVALAEAARRGVVISLIHLARFLTYAATYVPQFRGLSIGAKLSLLAGEWLAKSIIAWIGWQVAVEWSLDGFIQFFMKNVYEAIYEKAGGVKIHAPRMNVNWGLFRDAIYYTIAKFKDGVIPKEWEEVIEFIKREGGPRQKAILERVERALMFGQRLYNLKTMWWKDLHWVKRDASWQLYNYIRYDEPQRIRWFEQDLRWIYDSTLDMVKQLPYMYSRGAISQWESGGFITSALEQARETGQSVRGYRLLRGLPNPGGYPEIIPCIWEDIEAYPNGSYWQQIEWQDTGEQRRCEVPSYYGRCLTQVWVSDEYGEWREVEGEWDWQWLKDYFSSIKWLEGIVYWRVPIDGVVNYRVSNYLFKETPKLRLLLKNRCFSVVEMKAFVRGREFLENLAKERRYYEKRYMKGYIDIYQMVEKCNEEGECMTHTIRYSVPRNGEMVGLEKAIEAKVEPGKLIIQVKWRPICYYLRGYYSPCGDWEVVEREIEVGYNVPPLLIRRRRRRSKIICLTSD